MHCVKSVRIRSYSGSYFPAFGLNAKRYGASLHIQSERGKMQTRITPNTEIFHVMIYLFIKLFIYLIRYLQSIKKIVLRLIYID